MSFTAAEQLALLDLDRRVVLVGVALDDVFAFSLLFVPWYIVWIFVGPHAVVHCSPCRFFTRVRCDLWRFRFTVAFTDQSSVRTRDSNS